MILWKLLAIVIQTELIIQIGEMWILYKAH